ncbi:hypothetical protein Poli38472_006697 [Pythium oligandrum]|uniref:25S rRNA (uridine-N(3))-methyltransferase BMT5-like domain-containing protein n=1 Tax=Pythium oligandrum TaxID=41045 RepID=A0A8K1FEI8_PYTOL|nr:hypothetical protein Poli38472_006697 [Pythium oligandrum]|eukprot:TMW56687.1 hypothetical protein Poli38472_006697 [Pythium oligandrum]
MTRETKEMATEAARLRETENLYVHKDTLACALVQRCRPCCYKIVLHPRPGLLPNQRPEMCPRLAGTESKEAETPAAIGLCDETHVKRILTVGDGNFSFSLALARAFQKTEGVTLVVTSHESRESVIETYPDGERILTELAAMQHVEVQHGVDATSSSQMHAFGQFDRILWNFPCVRVPQGKDGQNEEMELNKKLLSDFFGHISKMLTSTGEVHVTHKTKPPFSQWGIEEIAAGQGLRHAQSVVFDRCMYPGYSNKKVLSKGSFPIWDSQTFVFVPANRSEDNAVYEKLEAVTAEMLEKAYLRLTPTIDEQMAQEQRLQKMKAKQTQGSGAVEAKKKRKKTNVSAPQAKKQKVDQPAQKHANQKHKKQKGRGKPRK